MSTTPPNSSGITNTPFRDGVIDSLPICVSFLFLFFSLGSLATTQGFSLAQSFGLTGAVYASPLQAWILQVRDAITVPTLIVAALLINFRFIILSSVLATRMRTVPAWKLLTMVATMSASSFAVTNPHRAQTDEEFYQYNVGVGVASYGTALMMTIAGGLITAAPSAWLTQLVAMILPIHFTTLIGSNWPKARPIVIAVVAVIAAPLAGHLIGEIQAIVMPFVIAAVFLLIDEISTSRKTGEGR